MKHIVIVLVVLANCACSPPADRQLRDLLESARLALWRGELVEAQTLATRGSALTRAQPDSEWAWTFSLLRADTLIYQNQLAEASSLLGVALPAGARFAALRSRQQYLNAR